MRNSRGRYDAQSVADLRVRRTSAQLNSMLALYDRKGGAGRPFVEGFAIADLIPLIEDELSASLRPSASEGTALEAVVTLEIATASGTTVTLSRTPAGEPLAVIESAHVFLTKVSAIPGPNQYTRQGNVLSLNTGRANSVLKLSYPYTSPSTNPGFEDLVAVGTVVTVAEAPTSAPILLDLTGHVVLTEVAATPGVNHFTRSGRALTLNAARANARVRAIYAWAANSDLVKMESLSPGGYPTYNATLSSTPTDNALVIAIWGPANLPLRYTTGTVGANDFKVVGTAFESGRQMTADAQIQVVYAYV